jgi:hypothetical protein
MGCRDVHINWTAVVPPTADDLLQRKSRQTRATNGHYSPLSGAREVGVTFNSRSPTGRAEVLSISKVASVPAVGELSEI